MYFDIYKCYDGFLFKGFFLKLNKLIYPVKIEVFRLYFPPSILIYVSVPIQGHVTVGSFVV